MFLDHPPRLYRPLLAIGLVLCLSACSSLNPFARRPAATQPAELVNFSASLKPRVLWSVELGGAEEAFFTPAVVDQAIYAAAANGQVTKINAQSGAILWQVKLAQKLSAGVGSDGQRVVVVAQNGDVLALDAQDGQLRWKTPSHSEVLSPPLVSRDIIVIRSSDSRILGLGAEQGELLWRYQRPAPALILREAPGMALGEGLVYAGFPGGRLLALSLAKGTLRWDITVSIPKGATELERVADLVGTPALSDKTVCVATFQGRSGCFETGSGATVWLRELSSRSGIATDARMAVLSDEQSSVIALTRSNGSSLWRNSQLQRRGVGVPLPLNHAVVVADQQGFIHWLARDDGRFLARIATDGSAIQAPLQHLASVGSSTVLVQTRAGRLQAVIAE